jgi:hypothetical protein
MEGISILESFYPFREGHIQINRFLVIEMYEDI